MNSFYCAAGLVVCSIASAQQPAAQSGVYRIGGGVSAPSVSEKREPQYTEEARIAKLQGTVVLSLVVGADGRAGNFHVVRSLGMGLDEKAIEAVSEWRFKPGMKEGQPVSVFANLEVNYRLLLDSRAWHLTRAACNLPAGASRPILIKARYPPSSGPEEGATVSLALDVDETGFPQNVHVEKSSDGKWEAEVTNMVTYDWRFSAALKDGNPVTAPCMLEFARGEAVTPGRR